MKRTVVQEREGEVLAYLRWVRGSSNLMPRHAGPIAKKRRSREDDVLGAPVKAPGGLESPLKKQTFLK